MKRKSILINAGMITRESSGVGVYSLELLKQLVPVLQKNEFTFTIYCYEPEIIQKMNICAVKKISLGSILDKLLANTRVFHRHIWNIIVLNFIARKYNILYSFTSHGTLFHPTQIITIHDVICLSFPDSHKGQYYYFRYVMPFLVRRSKHLVSISDFTKSEVVKKYSIKDKKISVIYNGVDHLEKLNWLKNDEEWLKTITEGKRFCICVGASYPHKNIESVLAVCQKMKHSDTRFLIINKPNAYYNSLQEKVREMQLTNVIFLPFLSSCRLALLYKTARLNIYLSLYEGFGFPPAEASFFKTQTLLSNQAALVEVYGKEDFEFTDPFDINRIEMIVSKYIFAEKKLESLSYSRLKHKYNWKNAAEKTVHVFQTI